jgi:flavodoxin
MEETHMKTLVIYCSHSGNTKRVAEAIGEALGPFGMTEVVPVETAATTIPADVDLVMIGSPTEGHGPAADARDFLDRLVGPSLRGRSAAAFDTRLNWPKLLSGSAAEGVARRLAAKGARVISPHGSFIVTTGPALEAGELERAKEWATAIATAAMPVTT